LTHSPPGSHAARRVLELVIAAASLVGCKDDACPKLEVCDVGEAACQRAVMRAVACIRGGSTELPPVSVVDEQQLLNMYEERGSMDEEAEVGYSRWNRGLALFGLAPTEYDLGRAREDSVGETAAVYFSDTKQIVLVDRGDSLRSPRAIEVLAHEFVHALQDAEHDLHGLHERWAEDFDSALALDALIEGEAVHYQLLTALALAGRSPRELRWEQYYESWQGETLRDAEHDEAPVALADMRFPYAFGGSFVAQHWLARGRGGIDALFEAPPRSTREVMFGSLPFDREAEREDLRERGVPALGEAFEPVSSTALGSWVTRIFAARMGLPVGGRLNAPRALVADLFSVQVDDASDQVVAAWRVRTEARVEDWPGLQRSLAIELDRGVDPDRREAFRVEAEAATETDEEIAWQAPSSSSEDDATAAAARRFDVLKFGAGTACRLRRPALEGELDATRTK
jgi:hypothetical protein